MHMKLQSNKIIVSEIANKTEFCYNLQNSTPSPIHLTTYELFRVDSLTDLGLGTTRPIHLFRSGRHKNDMPSVATFGVMDDSMKDALSGMTESGDKTEADGKLRTIVSDHLTILGNEDGYCLIGFMTGRDQLFQTEITIDEDGNFVSLSARVLFDIDLMPGQTVQTEILRMEHTKDINSAIAHFAEDKAKLYGSRNKQNLSVFCTWYYYGLTVTYQDVLTNLERMEQLKLPFDVFQIDEGWEITLGEWEPNEKFPVPMKEVADRIRKAGYRPGIWTSPFVAKETATLWQKHPDWLLKKNGEPCIFPMNGTTYYVLDITNPGTWDYFRKLYRKLTFDWGYTYHKLDFTRASVIYENADFYDRTITMAQAYYRAVKAIREGMGEDAYFLMCGGLYDPIIGLVDAQRTGSDVLSMWSSNINKDGKTAPYTIKQSILRYYMNAWWNNDPDALMVRKNETMERNLRLTYGLLNDEEVKTSTINQFIGGGIVCSTEPLDKISDERLYQLRHILPVVKTKVQPLDFMTGERFPSLVRVEFDHPGKWCIAKINWSDTKEQKASVTINEALLGTKEEPGAEYAVSDFYSGEFKLHVKWGETVPFAALAPHGATIIKIEKMQGKPIVVASDAHYSMGEEIDHLEYTGGKLVLEAQKRFDYPVKYKVWTPDGIVSAEL